MDERSEAMWRVWSLLAVAPILFFVVIAATFIYFGITTGADARGIAENVTHSTSSILLVVELLLLAALWATLGSERLPLRRIGWRMGTAQQVWREIFIGVVPGLVLVCVYLSILSPLMTTAQQVFGDYVPPGELLPSLGTAALPFFLANVVLAPFVEESIYRGYAMTRLRQRFNTHWTVVISCTFFGLLHWAGGFWYVVLTGSVAGGLFAGLFVWRKNVFAPYAAHLTVNFVEFLYVWQWVSR